MPMGYNWELYVFMKLLRVVQRHLREKGISILIYLDDMLVFHRSREGALADTLKVRQLILDL